MRLARAAVAVLGTALAGYMAGAAAQQAAPQQKPTPQQQLEQQQKAQQQKVQQQKAAPQKLTPQQQLEQQQKAAQSKLYYDSYEASRRLPMRAFGCDPTNEKQVGSFCVKTCKAGYVPVDDAKASTRQCRSEKPLPPGVMPVEGQKETAGRKPSAPKPPAKASAGA